MRKREFRAINNPVPVPVTGESLCLGYRKPRELKAKVSALRAFPRLNSLSLFPRPACLYTRLGSHSQLSGQTGLTLRVEVPVSVTIMPLGLGAILDGSCVLGLRLTDGERIP